MQQFLEALGLVKTPRVELSEDAIRLRGRPGEKIEYSLSVLTQENRAAIAHGSSDQPWLQVGRTIFRGRCAFLPLTVVATPVRPGDTLQARVTVIANGGQRFVVPVALSVVATAVPGQAPVPGILVPPRASKRLASPNPAWQTPAANPFEVLVPTTSVPHPRPAPVPGSGGKSWLLRGLLILACTIAVGTLLAVGVRLLRRDADSGPAPSPDPGPLLTLAFQDDPQDKYVGAATMTFGLVLPRQRKRLTFEERGRSNNVCYRLDDKEFLLGYEGGTWETPLQLQGSGGWALRLAVPGRAGRHYPDRRDRRRPPVGPAGHLPGALHPGEPRHPGAQGRPALSARHLHWLARRRAVRRAGLGQLCDTSCDRQGADVPDFLEALERDDLKEPGVIARVGLRGRAGLEVPVRVTVGAWPDAKLEATDKRARGNLTRWEVPLLSLKRRPIRP